MTLYVSLHYEKPIELFDIHEIAYKGYKRMPLIGAKENMFSNPGPYEITFRSIMFPEVRRNWWYTDYPFVRYFGIWNGIRLIKEGKVTPTIHLTPGTSYNLTITVTE